MKPLVTANIEKLRPYKPGKPIDDNVTIKVSTAYTGMIFHNPPNSSTSRV